MTTPHWKNVSDAAVAWIVLITAIIGSGFGFYKHSTHVEELKIEETQSFVERRNKTPIIEIRKELMGVWYENSEKIKKRSWEAYDRGADIQKEQDKVIMEIIQEKNLELNILMMFEFYDEIVVCVKRDICQGSLALEMFGKQIASFYNKFMPFVSYYCDRINNNKFAYNIHSFSRMYSGKNKNYGYGKQDTRLVTWKGKDHSGKPNPICVR